MRDTRWARLLTPIVALALCLGTGVVTRLPQASANQRERLANRFDFTKTYLNAAKPGSRTLRPVQPALKPIRSWISSVGAAVALADVDGDGLPNDRCLVDPRDDSVTVAPTPASPHRYRPFALLPSRRPASAPEAAPMGCVPADLNEDGAMDMLVHYWGRSPVAFLRRSGSELGRAAFRPVEIVAPRQVWNTNTLAVADVDGDGHLDLIVGNYFPDRARVLDKSVTHDPYMQMQDSMSDAGNGGLNRVLLWQSATSGRRPSVHFAWDRDALPQRAARSWTLAIGAQDLDGDTLPELYFANDFGPDQLFVNRSRPGRVRLREVHGERGFTTPKSKAVGNDSFKGMGVAFADLNNDQTPDILVSNITSPYALHESNFAYLSQGGEREFGGALASGTAPYRDRSEDLGISRSGWCWDVKTGDFDNDGDTEIVQANGFVDGRNKRWAELQELAMGNDELLRYVAAWPHVRPGDDLSGDEQNPFFVRTESGRYIDLAARLGLTNPGVSRGIALGDVDGDGRLDMAVANQWARSTFFRNTSHRRPFLGLRLRLPASDGTGTRPAVGAVATITRPDGRVLTDQVYPANGHSGVNAPGLLFGLGSGHTGRVQATIRWRDADGVHTLRRSFTPGWHTVTLGQNRGE